MYRYFSIKSNECTCIIQYQSLIDYAIPLQQKLPSCFVVVVVVLVEDFKYYDAGDPQGSFCGGWCWDEVIVWIFQRASRPDILPESSVLKVMGSEIRKRRVCAISKHFQGACHCHPGEISFEHTR